MFCLAWGACTTRGVCGLPLILSFSRKGRRDAEISSAQRTGRFPHPHPLADAVTLSANPPSQFAGRGAGVRGRSGCREISGQSRPGKDTRRWRRWIGGKRWKARLPELGEHPRGGADPQAAAPSDEKVASLASQAAPVIWLAGQGAIGQVLHRPRAHRGKRRGSRARLQALHEDGGDIRLSRRSARHPLSRYARAWRKGLRSGRRTSPSTRRNRT